MRVIVSVPMVAIALVAASPPAVAQGPPLPRQAYLGATLASPGGELPGVDLVLEWIRGVTERSSAAAWGSAGRP